MRAKGGRKTSSELEGKGGGLLASNLTWAEWRQVLAIAYTQFTMGMQMTLPYTLAVYMVRHYESGESISEERVSRLTGTLAAVSSTAQCMTALPWGYISDRIGRRPVVVVGNIVCMLTIVGFGAARNYEQAAAARFVGGFFNGITGALKTIIGESFDGDGQARALSALSCAWGLGTMFGSAIGGALADPCHLWGSWVPYCEPGQLLQRQPYLLPCAAVGALSFFASIISLTMLNETRTFRKHGAQYSKLADEERDSEAEEPYHNERPQRVAILVQEPPESELVPVTWTEKRQQRSGSECGSVSDSGGGGTPLRIHAVGAQPDLTASIPPRTASQEDLLVYMVDAADAQESGEPQLGSDRQTTTGTEQQVQDEPSPSRREGLVNESRQLPHEKDVVGGGRQQTPWYKCREVQLTVLGYGLIALFNTFVNELIPLFAATSKERGGLSLTASQLAGPLAFSGAVFLVYAAFGYPIFQRAVGTLASCLWGLALCAPAIAAIPLASMPRNSSTSQAVFYLSLAARQCASMNAFTSSNVMVNQACPAGQLGAVNGAAMTLASAVRAAGPALCGVIWAASLASMAPGHQYYPFCLAALGFCSIFLLYHFQRRHLPDATS